MFAFRLGTIPVRVHLMFFLTLALFGGALSGTAPQLLVLWIAIGFVGVLLHELGHALVGRSFGLTPQIDLIGFGGLTSWTVERPVKMTAGRRVAISIAGPMVSVILGGAALVWQRTSGVVLDRTPATIVEMFIDVNLGWGIFNLLPIMPMDGGNVLFAILQRMTNGNGEVPARVVSVVLALALAIFFFVLRRDPLGAVFVFAFFVLPHVRWFQARRGAAAPTDAPTPPRF